MLETLQDVLQRTISRYLDKFQEFKDAYVSYTKEHGEASVRIRPPTDLSDTVDPVTIIIGENIPLFFRDSTKTLEGNEASIKMERDRVYILGRKYLGHEQDGLIGVWDDNGETIIANYRKSLVEPSRMHAAIFYLDDSKGSLFFTDLGSSAGSIIAGVYATSGRHLIRIYEGRTGFLKEIPSFMPEIIPFK